MQIALAEIGFDGPGEFAHVAEASFSDGVFAQVAEKAFHQVEPGTGGGHKVHVKARMTGKPRFDARMFVGAVVVGDEVKCQSGGRLPIDLPQEGMLSILLASEGVSRVDDVPLIDSLGLTVKMAETMADLKATTGLSHSRHGWFNAAPRRERVEQVVEFYCRETWLSRNGNNADSG